ncbi:MAG: site-specific integrase, partial [Clostridia bacterium]|nr:site-specific integrase [Clostridia bacterium]
PKEIRFLRVSAVDFQNHCIVIDGKIAKNHHTRYAAMPSQVENLMLQLGIDKAPSQNYIIGKGYTPNAAQLTRPRLIKDWEKIRKRLDIPDTMPLYSFRDTGITEMLRSGIPEITVMQHADHSDLSITSIYAKHADPNLINTIRNKVPAF